MMKKNKTVITICIMLIASFFFSVSKVEAANQTAKIKASVPASLSLTLNSNNMDFLLNDEELHTKTLTITANTNSSAGYIVSFAPKNFYNYLKNTNDEDSNIVISSISKATTSDNFPETGWGYSIDRENFSVIPSTPINIFSTTTSGKNDYDFTVGVRASYDILSGKYENDMAFTAVANLVPITLSSISNMQDMTPEICANSAENEIKQLVDVRDGKTYWVTKLADNKCWMTQNLDLDLSTTTTLTPADSDVTTNWTPSRATIAGAANLNSANWADNYNNPYSFDPGNYYFDGTYYSSASCNYLTATCDHFATTPYDLNGEHGHVGNYYNWSAAVASNDTSATTAAGTDINTSICPKGWRLPHGHQSTQGSDFATLNTAYGGATNSDSVLLANPLFFVRGGSVYSGSLSNSAYFGDYWSSTARSAAHANAFNFYSHLVLTSVSDLRYNGFSVRCLARDEQQTSQQTQTLSSISNMQDMTSEICTNSVENESKRLLDTRDGKYYWVTKLADGNCWMTQNLDFKFDGNTLTPSSSNVAQSRVVNADETWYYWFAPGENPIYFQEGSEGYFMDGITEQHFKLAEMPSDDDLNGHYHIGDYYSWGAATAGDGLENESICPKNWYLPSSSSFENMIAAYNNLSDTALRYSPLFFVHGQYMTSEENDIDGASGFYWTSTETTSSEANAFYLSEGNITSSMEMPKYYTMSIRCIANHR